LLLLRWWWRRVIAKFLRVDVYVLTVVLDAVETTEGCRVVKVNCGILIFGSWVVDTIAHTPC